MAVFGAPAALEDHALRACLAALGIQQEVAGLAAEVERRDGVDLPLRVGLNSGQVIAGEIGSAALGYTAIGDQVGMAQRMESVAPPGGVMLSESTARLVEGVATLGGVERAASKAPINWCCARRLLGVHDGRTLSGVLSRIWSVGDGKCPRRGPVGSCHRRPRRGGRRGRGHRASARAVWCARWWRSQGVAAWRCSPPSASHTPPGPVPCRGTAAARDRRLEGLDGQTARDRVRDRVPDADPQDLLLLRRLSGHRRPGMRVAAIDPDARRRRLTALINSASWPAAPRRSSSSRTRTGSTRSANPCSPTSSR